jgi:hypothetical protein
LAQSFARLPIEQHASATLQNKPFAIERNRPGTRRIFQQWIFQALRTTFQRDLRRFSTIFSDVPDVSDVFSTHARKSGESFEEERKTKIRNTGHFI